MNEGQLAASVQPVLPEDELKRLYGPWKGRTPKDAEGLLSGYSGRWWIAGGWAIEAFTDGHRPHGDLDIGVARTDVPALYDRLAGQLDVWQADSGTLRPIIERSEPLPATCENLWLRRSGSEPWEYDVSLMAVDNGTWTYKRDARISLPLDDILWLREGVPFLRPEVQLLHKAPGLRPKDQADFEACLDLLAPQARAWLQEALRIAHPGHAWIAAL
jgi:hypothetical protein